MQIIMTWVRGLSTDRLLVGPVCYLPGAQKHYRYWQTGEKDCYQ